MFPSTQILIFHKIFTIFSEKINKRIPFRKCINYRWQHGQSIFNSTLSKNLQSVKIKIYLLKTPTQK